MPLVSAILRALEAPEIQRFVNSAHPALSRRLIMASLADPASVRPCRAQMSMIPFEANFSLPGEAAQWYHVAQLDNLFI